MYIFLKYWGGSRKFKTGAARSRRGRICGVCGLFRREIREKIHIIDIAAKL